ncbi:MAG: NfeD family protein [Cyanobacteria bacterium]|nr:NfeD family protein [Cyanobacteriota bacterium]
MLTPPLIWLPVGAVLLLLALTGLDTDGLLLIAGLSGLLLTVVSVLVVMPLAFQVLLFLGLVSLGYGWLRRWDRRQRDRALPASPRAEWAEVIQAFAADGEGRVRWQGQSWAAINLEPGQALAVGAQVRVMGREGTSLQVLPAAPLASG